jgi:hypothetical protein
VRAAYAVPSAALALITASTRRAVTRSVRWREPDGAGCEVVAQCGQATWSVWPHPVHVHSTMFFVVILLFYIWNVIAG